MKKRATAATGVVGVTEMLHTSVLSLWFAVFWKRRRPTIGMLTHSQHPRRDRPRRHKGIDMSHPRCIMVSSRKTPPVRFRYRPDRGRDHVVGADPSQGMAGRVREPRRWRLGAGPSEGSGPAFFAFSVPQGLPGAMAGTSRVSITNPGIRTLEDVMSANITTSLDEAPIFGSALPDERLAIGTVARSRSDARPEAGTERISSP